MELGELRHVEIWILGLLIRDGVEVLVRVGVACAVSALGVGDGGEGPGYHDAFYRGLLQGSSEDAAGSFDGGLEEIALDVFHLEDEGGGNVRDVGNVFHGFREGAWVLDVGHLDYFEAAAGKVLWVVVVDDCLGRI